MFRLVRSLFFIVLCSFCFAANLTPKIPPKIWQTYKNKELPQPVAEVQKTWTTLNPDFSYFLYDDADIEQYIQKEWPNFLDFFHALPIGAMKADLWRYLVLAKEGGVYSDIDSICIQPIQEWSLNGSKSKSNVLFLDLDSDQRQFCQWTIACTPHHPAMQYLCDYILKKWQKEGLPLTEDGAIDVLRATGPTIFSSAIKSYLNEPQNIGASKIAKKYFRNKKYRKRLNRLGIFFTPKGFFSGQGAKNLFWGSSQILGDSYNSWGREAKKLAETKPSCE